MVRDMQQQYDGDNDQDVYSPLLASLADSSEWPLLAQLRTLQYGLVPDPTQQQSSTPGGLPTLAPASNCLALLQQVVAQPLHPRAAIITSEELRQSYSASVRDSAMLLNLLHRPAAAQQHLTEPPLQQLTRLWERHIQLVVSLGLLQRGDLMFKFTLMNHITGELQAQVDQALLSWALQQLGLTQQQRQRIAGGCKEYFLTAAAGCYVTGCLTVEQLGRLAAVSWPYPPHMATCGRMIEQQLQQQQPWKHAQQQDWPTEDI
ncbi:hypothetical protein OEZ85_008925 [Tetradesmus obliquus]|uniref:CSN8/PSMD8/EIF3K domain-containing protein n=1 Tax=Tetradesmus obliquus TaxID=3088 RepID=A0ABY8TKM6_TETOB|nr:hypothetical protein OEZ85_008925 [Tetradesmus obliquus]